jgi:hypothetical protein
MLRLFVFDAAIAPMWSRGNAIGAHRSWWRRWCHLIHHQGTKRCRCTVPSTPSMHELACKCWGVAVDWLTGCNRDWCWWVDSKNGASCFTICIGFGASGFTSVYLIADGTRHRQSISYTTTNLIAHNNQKDKREHSGGHGVSF